MPKEVITDARQITLDWLNEALRDTAALTTGAVNHFELVESDSINATMIQLRLTYASESEGILPEALMLKICQDDSFSASEVHYYMRDYIDVHDAPLVHCYHASYAATPSRYHLLMDDLSATHRNNYDITPTLEYGRDVARALAKLHARWWGVEKLQKLHANIPTQSELTRYVAPARAGLEPMLSRVQAEIDPTWVDTLHTVFRDHPKSMLERTRNGSGFTLVHGDVNPGNILSPINGSDKTYLIDRQPFEESLTVWLGVSDLANMMVHPWDTDLRRTYEIPVLETYLEELVDAGVTAYAWNQLLYDYRLAAVQSFYVTISRCKEAEECDRMRWLWWSHLQRVMNAYFDLECDKL